MIVTVNLLRHNVVNVLLLVNWCSNPFPGAFNIARAEFLWWVVLVS